uniref:Vesicle transport protein n=1 Tax=Chaetoceros debilis TaxID=122233 RepID=A0A6S8VYV9_9STRA
MFSKITERLEVDMENLLPGNFGGQGNPNSNPNASSGGYHQINEDESGEYAGSGGFSGRSFFQLSSLSPSQSNGNDNDGDDDDVECLSYFFPDLTLQERLGGCLGCMLLGYVLSLGSFFRMKDVLRGRNPTPFVAYTTLGNIISLSGSFFLTGPRAQMRRMFHSSRRVATIMYLGSLFVTLLVCLVLPVLRHDGTGGGDGSGGGTGGGKGPSSAFRGEALLLLVLLGCQYVAVAWYCLSYIPFARQIARRLVSGLGRGGGGGWWPQFDVLD